MRSMVVIMRLLKSTIVNVPLLHISKQVYVITRHELKYHNEDSGTYFFCFAFSWNSRGWIFNKLLASLTEILFTSQNKIMFVLASINIILSCSSTHFWMVIGFGNASDIFHLRNLCSHDHLWHTLKHFGIRFSCNLAIFSVHWPIRSCAAQYFLECSEHLLRALFPYI